MTSLQVLDVPPGPTLAEIAAVVDDARHPVLLGSGGGRPDAEDSRAGRAAAPLDRWSMLAFDPRRVVTHVASDVRQPDAARRAVPRLLAAVRETFGPPTDAEAPRDESLPPFRGGAVALLGYDLGRELETLPARVAADAALPDLFAGLYPWVLAEERATGRRLVVGRGEPADARAFADEVAALARHAAPLPPPAPARDTPRSTFAREAYEAAVETVIAHIREGDIYQVNLSQRFDMPYEGSPAALHAGLAHRSPVPFGSLLRTPGFALVSNSPELFLRRRGDRFESRPIKGTRPRGVTSAEDEHLRAELEASDKEQAELAMIVDLVRNDLGRSARVGSVDVELPFQTDAWSTVFHRVARVHATLEPGACPASVVEAAFPPASVTGTPKIRAMQIVEDLEPVRRHAYTGATGWFDAGGDFDLSVNIRIATLVDGRLLVPVGGGITVGSVPSEEYRETLHKARAVFDVLGLGLPLGELVA